MRMVWGYIVLAAASIMLWPLFPVMAVAGPSLHGGSP
jgi:hypothetical protein